MTTPLGGRIRDLIRSEGPIPFERFQHLALYDPSGGFFAGDVLRSTKAGDFLTSPEVSPLFGRTLAAFVADQAGRLGASPTLVEVAAGSGSLLRPLLGEMPDLDTWAVEVSPAARSALRSLLAPDRVVESLDEVPSPLAGVILANELIDNLPVAIAARTADGWEERWVGADGNRLVLLPHPAREAVQQWCSRYGGPVSTGGLVEVQLEAEAWLRRALGMVSAGSVVVIDYGDTAEGLAPRRSHGTLRTYRAHHLGPDPLAEPGATDITSDVNFSALEAVALEEGASVEYHRQDEFLESLGLRQALSELRHRELELARDGDPMDRLRIRSIKTEAETLLHPRGLGDFRVLVARKG
ncbi:MAG: SAM-dependent methyltransferase [Acidimicrobiia bacterium]|nr:SAM-dependent methyltransferase [Acidimicrobiia bacterium]